MEILRSDPPLTPRRATPSISSALLGVGVAPAREETACGGRKGAVQGLLHSTHDRPAILRRQVAEGFFLEH